MTHEIMIVDECSGRQEHQQQQQQQQLPPSSSLQRSRNCNVNDKTVGVDDRMLLILRKKRRAFHNHTCLLSVMAAFTIGLAMGIFFLPLIGLTSAKSNTNINSSSNSGDANIMLKHSKLHKYDFHKSSQNLMATKGKLTPATINNKNRNNNFLNNNPNIYSSVSFISDEKFSTEENILNSWNNGNVARKANNDYGIVAATENDDVAVDDDVAVAIPGKEDEVDDGNPKYSNNKRRIMNDLEHDSSSSSGGGGMQQSHNNKIANRQKQQQSDHAAAADDDENVDDLNSQPSSFERENNKTMRRIIEDNIYWGQIIEDRIPDGYNKRDTEDWQNYLESNITEIIKIEQGCGRMQNRLVTFGDGVKACVRYRQNTDQIQGELFSFFLGRLLNITNLVPSTASVIDWDSRLWQQVKQHITESQWKTSRPVVFTKWIPDLEPSGIPEQFRPLERHMNKNDIWNITLDDGTTAKPSQILIDRLKAKYNGEESAAMRRRVWQKKKIILNDRMMDKFIELAQWSDLIVFDYLIANLDRVVNNLYNFQWNAEIMAAPAHNLARQPNSQLLVFLDNESGLLHGYRLLKKYEPYHSLLLDDLCIFRKSTIEALRALRDNNAGDLLNAIFEQTTTNKVRDVLPPLPDKSIKILSDRIDRVLQQVQKCQDLYSYR
jgi:four-jointed box protein 1